MQNLNWGKVLFLLEEEQILCQMMNSILLKLLNLINLLQINKKKIMVKQDISWLVSLMYLGLLQCQLLCFKVNQIFNLIIMELESALMIKYLWMDFKITSLLFLILILIKNILLAWMLLNLIIKDVSYFIFRKIINEIFSDVEN